MKSYVLSALEYALTGVDEVDQNIFENYKNREEVKFHVENIEEEFEREESDRKQTSNTDKNESGKNEGAKRIDENGANKQTEVVETFRRDVRRQELTRVGKRFVNTMMDHCYCVKAIDFDLDELFQINKYPYPNINLTKILNLSRKAFYHVDAEMFNDNDDRNILRYPLFDGVNVEDIDWEYHEGEVEIMDPDEFERTWKRIIRVSKRLDNVQINQQLTKDVLFWDSIKCAYNDDNKLVVKFGAIPTKDELMLTHLTKPYWKYNSVPFGKEEREGHFDRLDIQEWLVKSPGSNNSNDDKSSKNTGKKESDKRSRIKEKGEKKKNSKPQPENDSKADAKNPNNQSK